MVSYGGGVNSTALLIGLHQHRIPVDLILFADTGAEHPHTYAYLDIMDRWLKQYAFDSYCKKVLKCEACNGYRQISRRQKRFTSLEELSEAEMAQLAVYDRYPWEYTTFPVGGAVILIEDDGLAEALLGLSQEDREIFMMHWFLRMTDAQIARYINMPRRTVNTRRHKAYRLLTELMGGEADD